MSHGKKTGPDVPRTGNVGLLADVAPPTSEDGVVAANGCKQSDFSQEALAGSDGRCS